MLKSKLPTSWYNKHIGTLVDLYAGFSMQFQEIACGRVAHVIGIKYPGIS